MSYPHLKKIIITAVIISILSGLYFFLQYQNLSRLSKLDEVERYTSEVGRLIKLPEEKPTIATVTDKAKLDSQPFYQKAQNGDKVLIFEKAQTAILYRPDTKKIIDVTKIEGEIQKASDEAKVAQTLEAQGSPVPISPFTLAILNSTEINGLTKIAESALRDREPDLQFSVPVRDNAKGQYGKTLIIPIKSANPTLMSRLKSAFRAEEAQMPAGEATPEADMLVILGTDYNAGQ